MMIDKISGINPINNVQGTKRSSQTSSVRQASDQISVSEEAKSLSDAYYLNKVAEETPDVRADLVEQIKLKIQDPNYLSPATIEATADRILSAYGF
ncbi:MAG: flagellar biosynthesis anti-sigma factor FlgM [Treponema sp.]|nr:flagellar biosynthesis anti-sigma factor FlgM [Treponema sp.]